MLLARKMWWQNWPPWWWCHQVHHPGIDQIKYKNPLFLTYLFVTGNLVKLAYLCLESEIISSHTSQNITRFSAHVIVLKTFQAHECQHFLRSLAFPELGPRIQFESLSSPALFGNYVTTTFITDGASPGGNVRFIIRNVFWLVMLLICHKLSELILPMTLLIIQVLWIATFGCCISWTGIGCITAHAFMDVFHKYMFSNVL